MGYIGKNRNLTKITSSWELHNNMHFIGVQIREYICNLTQRVLQFLNAFDIFNELKAIKRILTAIARVNVDLPEANLSCMQLAPKQCAHFPELESVSMDMFKYMLLLILNRSLEGKNILVIRDLECENVTWIFAVHKAVDLA
jgi:hypothetical protein